MIKKSQAGYLHLSGTQYECGDCIFYLDKMSRCALIMDEEKVVTYDGCNYFVKGNVANLIQIQPTLNVDEVGYVRSYFGFSCKRCEYFNPEGWSCKIVDKDSSGDDSEMIHPDGCCNGWEADSERGQLPTDLVTELTQKGPVESISGFDMD